MKRNLTKSEILRKRKDIKDVFLSGKGFGISGLKIKAIKNNFTFTRVLVTFVRKYGTSVERNKAKRRVKEIYRLNRETIQPGYDIVFILYPGSYSFQDRYDQFSKVLKKSGLQQA